MTLLPAHLMGCSNTRSVRHPMPLEDSTELLAPGPAPSVTHHSIDQIVLMREPSPLNAGTSATTSPRISIRFDVNSTDTVRSKLGLARTGRVPTRFAAAAFVGFAGHPLIQGVRRPRPLVEETSSA